MIEFCPFIFKMTLEKSKTREAKENHYFFVDVPRKKFYLDGHFLKLGASLKDADFDKEEGILNFMYEIHDPLEVERVGDFTETDCGIALDVMKAYEGGNDPDSKYASEVVIISDYMLGQVRRP